MHKYEQHAEISFKSFRQVWKQMKFSKVHQENLDTDTSEYIHACYYHFLSFLFVEAPLIIRVGVVYGIYLLYFTQPISPKAKLTVTTTVWIPLKTTVDDMKEKRIADGYQCYLKLLEDGAIYFSAVLNPAAALVHIEGDEGHKEADSLASPEVSEVEPSSASHGEMEGEAGRHGGFTMGSFIDMATLETIASNYTLAKLGCVNREAESTAPASLSLETNLPEDLRTILEDMHQGKAALTGSNPASSQ